LPAIVVNDIDNDGGWDGRCRQTKEASRMMKGGDGKPPPRFAAKSERVGQAPSLSLVVNDNT
jgi:hypothetical protein